MSKAILNKEFDKYLGLIEYIWERRHSYDILDNYPKSKLDLLDVHILYSIERAASNMSLYKSKIDFTVDVFSYANTPFIEMFVKRFEK